jgi:hypothetical protein
MELDDILSDKKEQTNEEPVIVKEEPVKSSRSEFRERELEARAEGEGKQRDPVTGKYVPKEEPKVEEPKKEEPKPEPKVEQKQDFSERERAFLATAQEERRKRQELEERIKALETPKEAPKPFFEDPDGALKQRDDQIAQTRMEFQQMMFQTRLQSAEEIARIKYQDYDQAVEIFKEVAGQAPGLIQQCMASPNPAEFAYKLGKHHKEMRDVGSVDAYKQKIEKELRIKLEAEMKEKMEAELKARKDLVPSLSDARSTQSNKAVWGGPPPLEDILGK